MTLKHHYKLPVVNTECYKRILTNMFPVLYSPNEPVYILGFFYLQEAYLYAKVIGDFLGQIFFKILTNFCS